MEVNALFRVRANQPSLEQLPQGENEQAAINTRGDILIAQALPERTEITRMRKSFQVVAAIGTPRAPVVALPTTAALLSIWNGEADGGRVYLIDKIGCICHATAAAATGLGMIHTLGVTKVVAPTSTALAMRGTCGQVYSGQAINTENGTVVDSGWFPVGNTVVGPTSQLAMVVEAQIYGGIIVPPGYQYSISVLANTAATITVRSYIVWHEVLLAMGS